MSKGKIHLEIMKYTKCGINLISIHSKHIKTIKSTDKTKYNFDDRCKKCFKLRNQCSTMIDMDNYKQCPNIGNNIETHKSVGIYGPFKYVTYSCNDHKKGKN